MEHGVTDCQVKESFGKATLNLGINVAYNFQIRRHRHSGKSVTCPGHFAVKWGTAPIES
jgi:hypothetical protein